MKKIITILLIVSCLSIFSQETHDDISKIKISFMYINNIQIMDKDIPPVNLIYEESKYLTTYSSSININFTFNIKKHFAFNTGINFFSEKINEENTYSGKNIYIIPFEEAQNNDTSTNSEYLLPHKYIDKTIYTYLTIPIEFMYNFHINDFNISPYLGLNINTLFLYKIKYGFKSNSDFSEFTGFNKQIHISFNGGFELSKSISEKLLLNLRLNYQASYKYNIKNEYYIYKINSFGLGVGIKYNL